MKQKKSLRHKSVGYIALEKIAQEQGVSIKEVRLEIQNAINQALTNPDPKIQAAWKSICRNGKPPSPEKLVEILLNNIKDG